MTAEEVVDRIESSWQELDALAAAMDAGALSAPGPESWAVKDHLVHVGAWEHWLLALFEGRDKLAAMGADGANRQIDDVNAVVFENHRQDTVPQALAYFRAAHQQLMAVLRTQSTEDFNRPYATFFNAGREASQQPVLEAVAGNTYDHYPEHVQWIKELTASRGQR
jgi:uncharacterized damage-inducible protein DinB